MYMFKLFSDFPDQFLSWADWAECPVRKRRMSNTGCDIKRLTFISFSQDVIPNRGSYVRQDLLKMPIP